MPEPIDQTWISEDFLAGDSVMARLIRAKDWSTSTLGPIEQWPQALKSVLGVGLNSRLPVCIYWGHDLNLLYNDDWSAIPGDKHPWALGQPAREAWADIWSIIGPMYTGILQTGIAVHAEDGMLPMQRFGYVEECYFTYNVSPIFGSDGKPAGLFNTVIETTANVLQGRRQQLLGRLRDSVHTATSVTDACRDAARLIGGAPEDLPFFLFYVNTPEEARLHASCGLAAGHPLAPLEIELGQESQAWPLDIAAKRRGLVQCEGASCGPLAPWPEPVNDACVLPLFTEGGAQEALGFLVCGISPRRQLDNGYTEFLEELASCLAYGLAQVMVHAEELRQAAEMARRVELRTRERDRIWSLSQDLLCVVDITGVLISVNPAWSNVLGWSEDELLGKTTRWIEHPEDLASSDEKRQTLAEGQRLERFENRMRHKDGSYRWISWSATPENNLLYGNGRDITEEKRTAAVLAETEAALRSAQRMEAVGQLSGGIAHDFNNLLAGIQVSLDLIERRMPDEVRVELGRFVQAASDSTRRGAALTSSLLSFARRQALDLQPVPLNTLIEELREQLEETAGTRTHLMLELSPQAGNIRSDVNQLRNVLLHLTSNARDAMPMGGSLYIATRTISAPAEADIPAGDYLRLEVRDSGSGMEKDVAARAFEPFFTTKPLGKGSGLGLSMVYGFIKQIGGQIRLDSKPGAGTRVSLYFPRDAVAPAEEQPAMIEPLPVEPRRESILVVEDADVVRMLTVEVLEEFGYQVLQAADAEDALLVLRSDAPIGLLMTDVGLPGMNGQQLAVEAQRLRPGLRVLFATGYAEIVSIDGSELATHMDVISKPFSLDDLREKVKNLLDGANG
ncbi:ATP-binding protein [Pseudomonas sp. LRF_L74]|uniref:ATP-binding protein n=1 Tax=Pseudomonas sp. LRF_L74 TaxID=3369422 RepID=UPI003F604585